MSSTGEYQRDCWQIVVDPLGYPSIHETDEDGRPGDLVAHCFADRESLIAAAPDMHADLKWYAEQFCELGSSHECCGKLSDDECSGCRAVRSLAKAKGSDQ